MNDSPEKSRYIVVGAIWLGVMILSALMVMSGSITGEGLGGFMGAAAFVAAAFATGVIFQWGQLPETPSIEQRDSGKTKNDQQNLDPMSLLTHEDIAELREDIKMSVRRRLLQDSDGELNSIDALIADQDQAHKRQRR